MLRAILWGCKSGWLPWASYFGGPLGQCHTGPADSTLGTCRGHNHSAQLLCTASSTLGLLATPLSPRALATCHPTPPQGVRDKHPCSGGSSSYNPAMLVLVSCPAGDASLRQHQGLLWERTRMPSLSLSNCLLLILLLLVPSQKGVNWDERMGWRKWVGGEEGNGDNGQFYQSPTS